MTTDFDILHSLQVKGLSAPEVLAALSGAEDVGLAAAGLVEAGLVQIREGRFGGYLLTPTGKTEAARQLAADPATNSAKGALAAFDEAFLPVNSSFKKICHSWQVKPGGLPNDHSDAEYDAQVVVALGECHERIVPLVAELAAELPRFGRYTGRLDAALERVRGGDVGAFARPMYDSYHDIWMELHNDAVLSVGRQRGGADEQVP